jgi:adenylate cyclase class 2
MAFEEIEVKFYVRALGPIADRLVHLGAELERPRLLEVNLRFDLPDGSLGRSDRVLRLRKSGGEAARLTYKGPGEQRGDVRIREEIEFIVGDGAAARAFLEALGFQVVTTYEKYRRIYTFAGRHIMLDELPFGLFVEIEGESPESLRETAEALGLDWGKRIPSNYLALFEKARQARGLRFHDLTFENFNGLQIEAADLQVVPAD